MESTTVNIYMNHAQFAACSLLYCAINGKGLARQTNCRSRCHFCGGGSSANEMMPRQMTLNTDIPARVCEGNEEDKGGSSVSRSIVLVCPCRRLREGVHVGVARVYNEAELPFPSLP